eukprot:SAG11_NODE_36582_length_260_cov_16.062112_1_plen_59_part_01
MFFLYVSYRSFTRNSWWSKKCDFIFRYVLGYGYTGALHRKFQKFELVPVQQCTGMGKFE